MGKKKAAEQISVKLVTIPLVETVTPDGDNK